MFCIGWHCHLSHQYLCNFWFLVIKKIYKTSASGFNLFDTMPSIYGILISHISFASVGRNVLNMTRLLLAAVGDKLLYMCRHVVHSVVVNLRSKNHGQNSWGFWRQRTTTVSCSEKRVNMSTLARYRLLHRLFLCKLHKASIDLVISFK